MADPDFPSIAVRSYDDLVIALRAVKEFLGLSNETVEEVAGITRGHFDKIFGPSREKRLGPLSLPLILGALGVQLRVEIDPEQANRVAARWTKRNEKQIRTSQPLSAATLARAAAELGRRGAIAAAKARHQARRQAQRRNGHGANGHAR